MHLLRVEALLLLHVDMLEHGGTLLGQIHLHPRREGHRLEIRPVELAELPAQEEDRPLAIHLEAAVTGILRHQLRIPLAQVEFPEVETLLERRQVIERLALLVHDRRSEVRRVRRQARDAVLDSLELDHDRLNGRRLLLLLRSSLLFLVRLLALLLGFLLPLGLLAGLLLLLLEGLAQFVVLLAQAELVVGILIEEDEHHVAQRTPRSVGPHAVAVGLEEDGIAVEHPPRRRTEVTAAGQVRDLTALGADQTDIRIGVVAVADELEGKPPPVGRPSIVEAAAGPVPRAAVGDLVHLLRVEIDDHQPVAVLDEGQLLAVGRELRAGTLEFRLGQQPLLAEHRRVGESFLLIAHDRRPIKVPFAVPLTGIDQRPVVGAPRHVALRGCRLGHPLRRAVLDRGHEEFAAHREGDLLAVGRHGRVRSPGGEVEDGLLPGIVARKVDHHLAGFAAGRLGIDLAVVGIAQRAVVTHRKETHGMRAEMGHGSYLGRVVQRERVDVERPSVALAEEVDLRPVG